MAEAKRDEGATDCGLSLPAATEQERDLAQAATNAFERADFDACLSTLSKLAVTRANDPKLMLNRAVAEYYRGGFVRTDALRKVLAEVCVKAHLNAEGIGGLDDVDHCVVYYNQAVVAYHLKQYKQAITLLDKLFQFIEPMEEILARKLLFLLVQLYLSTHQPEKAMGILAFIEKMLLGTAAGGSTSGKVSPEKDREGGGGGKEAWREPKEGGSEAGGGGNDSYRPQICQYKAQCYMMLKSFKSCKREMRTLMSTLGMSTPTIYLKSHFEYLRGNYRKAMKILGTTPQAPPGAKATPGGAAGEEGRGAAETPDCLATKFYNNLGAIHFHLRKHHLAAFYFRRAIDANTKATVALSEAKNFDDLLLTRPLHTLGVSQHYELLYNMGVQQLHCAQPLAAFDCLIETVQAYQVNPRLWLRLAECCIMVHKQDNDDDRSLSKRMQVIQGSVGSGVHRKLILGSGAETVTSPSVDSVAMPVASLEFASLCLKNALMLLPSKLPPPAPHPTPADDQADPRPTETFLVPAPPGNPMKATEVANIRCSLLASSSYVSLCLSDYLGALRHAQQLLWQPRLSGAHSYLGHLYVAEAQVALDHIADAIDHLNADNITDVSPLFPEQKTDSDKNGDKEPQEQTEVKGAPYAWSPRDVPRARAIMQYNLASAHATRGEYEKALVHLSKSTQMIGSPLPVQVYYLKLYLVLMEGQRKVAQNVIKEHFGHVTANHG